MSVTHIVVAKKGDSSGLTRTYTLADSIFYAAQDTVILDWNCSKAYGTTSFINKSFLVSIFYQPQDIDGNPLAEPIVVGGYVSPWNFPVYGKFRTEALRIGIKYSDVKQAIEDRINFAKSLINADGSGDESRSGGLAFLNRSVNLLEWRLKTVKKVIDQGIRICILCEASRTINYRRKEIIDYVVFNQGFFDTYYPSSAFPIGSPLQYKSKDSWIDRDYFVYNMFKLEKEPILGTDNGIVSILPAHQWILQPITFSRKNWKVGLKIDFLRIPSSKKKSKPTVDPPQIKSPQVLPPGEAAGDVIDGLAPGGGGVPPERIKEAISVAGDIDGGAEALNEAGKDKQAEKYRSHSDDIRNEIIDTMAGEAEEIVEKINNTDVLGPEFEEIINDAIDFIDDMAKLENTGELSGRVYEQKKEKLMTAFSNAYGKRAQELAQGHRNISVDSTDLEGSELEIIDSMSRSQLTGDGGNTGNTVFNILGEKRKESAQKRLSDWKRTDRMNPDFFKVPQWIFEDVKQMQLFGEDVESNDIFSNIKDKIIIEIRAEINSATTDETKLNELFDLSKKLGLEKSLPIDIFQSYIDKLNDSKPSELVGQGAANLSGSGNVQKIE